MATKHNSLKRITHRCIEECRATYNIAKKTSVRDALLTFRTKIDIQKMTRNGLREPPALTERLLKKHNVMLRYFKTDFKDFLQNYRFDSCVMDDDPSARNKVWVCWWQGIDNAPYIVKMCAKSIQENAPANSVIILNEDNYKKYTSIPAWVEEKKNRGIISRTHFSDLLRLNLLSLHGGIWLDATMFCTHPWIEEYLKLPLWSIKRPDYGHCSAACGNFATYSLGCTYENRKVFAIIYDFMLNYWSNYNYLIDYLLFTYMIRIAQDYDKDVKACFEEIVPNNPECDELFKILNEPFDADLWDNLKSKTAFFKLNWKQSYSVKNGGKDTFYAKLLSGDLR